MATAYICYLPQHAFGLITAVDMDEITQLQQVLTDELMPTLEYGNYTSINITALFQQIKQLAPNSYAGIMQWLVPYKTRFQHLSTNAKRFLANSKRRLTGLQSQQDELASNYTVVKSNINTILTSWNALPEPDQDCIASFIGTMHNAIMSPEFNDFINSAASANSQDELQLVLLDFATVLSSLNRKTLFSAQHPLVTIDHKIRKLSSSVIVTNKIRSAVLEDLEVTANDLVIRGNEGVQVEARGFNVSAQTFLALNTSVSNITVIL
ncbi:hypothetical protein FO519_007335 [Halicephalobus sp. NKZ332]|nr:hypothetical protein FO519_007335 [Halicephalobus sp. NKZ332]